MPYSDFAPNVLQTGRLIFFLERDTLLCILLDYYNIKRVHIIPVERPPELAIPVLPPLIEHTFEDQFRWDLLSPLSGWVGVPGLKCPPCQIVNVSPGSTEPGLHSSYLLGSRLLWRVSSPLSGWVGVLGLKCPPCQIVNVSPGSTEPGLHSSYLLGGRLLWRLLYHLLWGRSRLGHFRKSR